MLSKEEFKKFIATKEQEIEVEKFLDKNYIQRRFKGYNFMKHMIIYILNDYIYTYNIKNIYDLYEICAEYEGTSKYNIRRLIDYASNEFFARNGNKAKGVTPYQLMLKALHEIKFKEEYKNAYKTIKL